MNNIEKFEKLCSQIFFWKGEFRFPFDGIQHDKRFVDIVNDNDYDVYKNKMQNLLKMINKDMSRINMDTKELWEVI